MPGTATSVTNFVLPNTLPGTSLRGTDVPTSLYRLTGLGFALPVALSQFPYLRFHFMVTLK